MKTLFLILTLFVFDAIAEPVAKTVISDPSGPDSYLVLLTDEVVDYCPDNFYKSYTVERKDVQQCWFPGEMLRTAILFFPKSGSSFHIYGIQVIPTAHGLGEFNLKITRFLNRMNMERVYKLHPEMRR